MHRILLQLLLKDVFYCDDMMLVLVMLLLRLLLMIEMLQVHIVTAVTTYCYSYY